MGLKLIPGIVKLATKDSHNKGDENKDSNSTLQHGQEALTTIVHKLVNGLLMHVQGSWQELDLKLLNDPLHPVWHSLILQWSVLNYVT